MVRLARPLPQLGAARVGGRAFLGTLALPRLEVWALAVGFGASTHILWELVEYGVMALGSSGLSLTYEDTIGDLALSFGSSLAGAAVSVTLLWPRRRATRRSSASP